MTILKLPRQKKQIRLMESGNTYEMDITDIEAMRSLSALSRSAIRTINGTIWTKVEELQIIKECKAAIDTALGKGSFDRMVLEEPRIAGNAVLTLGICAQIYDISKNAVNDYINQYRRTTSDLEDLQALLSSLTQVEKIVSSEAQI